MYDPTVLAVDAMTAQRNLARAMGMDVDGIRTIEGARAAYVRGRIGVEDFEARVEHILRDGEPSYCDLHGCIPIARVGSPRVFCVHCGADA